MRFSQRRASGSGRCRSSLAVVSHAAHEVVSTLTSRTLLVIATCQALAGCGTRVIQPPVVPRTGQVELFGSFIVERARTAHDGRPDVGGLSGGWYDRQTRGIWTVSDGVQGPRLPGLS